MLMDISYDWILRKLANFHCQLRYWYHKQHNEWYNIFVIIIFSWKLGLHFYRTFIFLEELSYDCVWKSGYPIVKQNLIQGLGIAGCCFFYYVTFTLCPRGHGSHDFGHRGQNGVTVTQRRRTGSTNVARRGCRDRPDRFLNSQKISHGSHGRIDLLKCAVVERGERNKTWQNVTYLNTTWSMSVAGRLVTRRQPKVCQGLSRSIKFCCGLTRSPNPTPQLEPEHEV